MDIEIKPWNRYRFINKVNEVSIYIKFPDGSATIIWPDGSATMADCGINSWRGLLNELKSKGFVYAGEEGRDPASPPM